MSAGATRMKTAEAYPFAGGAAGLDLSLSRETWEESGETAVFVSLWSSEDWLGSN